jgi:adenylate kinase
MKLILLGAPGAGKGTQADILSRKLNIPTISTGNMLRAAISNGSAVGLEAKSYMDKGALVPDSVIIGIVKERLAESDCANGYILDGMPRTIPQAEALRDNGIDFDAVVSLEISDDEIVERMSGRRVCPKCGATFHVVSNPPKTEGVCDNCGEALIIRPDDAPETVRSRLDVYHQQTEPLKQFYAQMGNLRSVANAGSIEAVSQGIFKALGIGE